MDINLNTNYLFLKKIIFYILNLGIPKKMKTFIYYHKLQYSGDEKLGSPKFIGSLI